MKLIQACTDRKPVKICGNFGERKKILRLWDMLEREFVYVAVGPETMFYHRFVHQEEVETLFLSLKEVKIKSVQTRPDAREEVQIYGYPKVVSEARLGAYKDKYPERFV